MSEVYNIYFNESKEAFAYEIEDPICVITSDVWEQYAGTDTWDIVDGEFVDITDTPEYQEEKAAEREAQFHKEFFNTSLGYIRRSVTMKDGSKKDFLGELLMPIKAGLELGQEVVIITYRQPDFSEDVTDWTQYQDKKQATPQFIQDCLNQIVIDFNGIEG